MIDVYIALGSNVGNRSTNINTALSRLNLLGTVIDTSHLYESAPMYVLDQATFLNSVCLLRTELTPSALLHALKEIEIGMGRAKTIRNGPRLIDLDIVLFRDGSAFNSADLQVPHPRIQERNFVLQPLLDIDDSLEIPFVSSYPFPVKARKLLTELVSTDDLKQVTPFGRHADGRDRLLSSGEVSICGILNATPDSFSDGGVNAQSITHALKYVEQMISEGADMIDIGGESTRPGASEVPVKEEIDRVVPIIRAIRAAGLTCTLSVDTRKSAVAEAAVAAGADIVNDVSAGSFDHTMLTTVATLKVPIILNHARGTPDTMQQPRHVTYPGGVVFDVAAELNERLQAATSAGIPKWMQIVDPGIGFSKDAKGCIDLINPANASALKAALGGRPVMVGLSRKRFIEHILLSDSGNLAPSSIAANQRDFGTAGACCAAILGGASILRVHNVLAVKQAVSVFRKLVGK